MENPGVTELLHRLSAGDGAAGAELMPIVYRELHRVAAAHLRHERGGHTMQATALVHEAYLKLIHQSSVTWKDRAHFFALASQSMRRILVDYARSKSAEKRGGGQIRLQLDDNLAVPDGQFLLVMEVDEALERLEAFKPRLARVVELRFFTGLSEEEIAEVFGVTTRTVKRDWAAARAWLYGQLRRPKDKE